MENSRDLLTENDEKYFDEQYYITKFRQEISDEPDSNNYFIIEDSETQGRVNIRLNLSGIDVTTETDNNSEDLHGGTDDANEQEPQDISFFDGNFVDSIVRSKESIKRLEKSIELKRKKLLESETTIKDLFTQLMRLQHQVFLSHEYTCDYMIDDLKSIDRLLGRLDKPVGKTKVEAETTLWKKESEKTNLLINNLKEFFEKTLTEIFGKNYKSLHNVPIFTMFISDNASILHKQFFDHFNELYSCGQVHAGFIQSLHEDFSQLKSDVHRKFIQLTEKANNIFYSTMPENQ